jgi:hypothetical protein
LETARELIAPVASDLRTRLGSIIYGEDQETIENATLSLLNKQGLTSSWIITGVEANFRRRLETACHDLAMAFPPVDGFAVISSIPVESESAIESIASAAAQWVRDKYSTDFGVAILTRHLDDVRFEGAIGVSSIHGHDWRPRRWTQDYPDATTWLVTYAFATLRRQALKILKADTE